MAKSDSSEMQIRINTIYAMLLQGLQRKSIIHYCADKWEISERQVDEYLRQARLLMSDDSQRDIDYKKSEILSQYYDLYNKSYKNEDYKECKSILESISKVLGVSAPAKLDMTSNGESINIINLGNGINPEL
jgi:nucleotidyltransferase/DNA polymerase involved in DNA repair